MEIVLIHGANASKISWNWVGDNDGVVTVDSQRELFGPHKEIVLDYGHNEVLQSPELVEIIRNY